MESTEDLDFYEVLDHPDAAVVSASEESWGDEVADEKPEADPIDSDSDDFSIISDEGYDKQSWLDISRPINNRSDSTDSAWEVLSIDSLDAVSLCSVNDLARRAIEEHEMLQRENLDKSEEEIIDETINPESQICGDEKIENKIKRKKKKRKKRNKFKTTVNCGLVLFRKAGSEVACIKSSKRTMTTPVSKMKKGESPLETAIRAFKKKTGCMNFDAFAILHKVIQIPEDNKLVLVFPAIIERELFFSQDDSTFQVDWYPTKSVADRNKSKNQKHLATIVQNAYALLVEHRHELPNVVNDEVAQTVDLATYELYDYILMREKKITYAETKAFLSSNHEDLQLMLNGCGTEEKEAMIRKLIYQLPHVRESEIYVNPNIAALVDMNLIHESLVTEISPLNQLENIILKNYGDNGKLKWKSLKKDIRESPCICDEFVQNVLVSAGWDMGKLKFDSNTNKEERQEILLQMLHHMQHSTQI